MRKIVFLNIDRINYDGKLDLKKYGDNIIYYGSTSREEILEHVSNASVVVVKELVMDKEIIDSLPGSVELICEAGTGYNNIDVETARSRGIKVCNVPSYATNSVAAFTMMLILNMSTSIHKQNKMLFNDDFGNFGSFLKVDYRDVEGKTLGIIGMGRIGTRVSGIARAFGMKIIAYSHTIKESTELVEYVSLDELLRRSDYISLHSLLNDETYHLLNENNMNNIKDGAFIINTARGALIDEKVLVKLLNSGKIAGAGLDVLEHEPGTKENPLFDMDNVIVTPHMAWNSLESRERLMDTVIDNINSFVDGNGKNIV